MPPSVHLAAPEDHFAGRIRGLQLQPDIEGIERAAREEVSDLARPHDDVDARRRTGHELRLRQIERRRHVAHFANEGVALLFGFFAHGEPELSVGPVAARRIMAVCLPVFSTGEAAKISTEMKPDVRNFCSAAAARRPDWRMASAVFAAGKRCEWILPPAIAGFRRRLQRHVAIRAGLAFGG